MQKLKLLKISNEDNCQKLSKVRIYLKKIIWISVLTYPGTSVEFGSNKIFICSDTHEGSVFKLLQRVVRPVWSCSVDLLTIPDSE